MSTQDDDSINFKAWFALIIGIVLFFYIENNFNVSGFWNHFMLFLFLICGLPIATIFYSSFKEVADEQNHRNKSIDRETAYKKKELYLDVVGIFASKKRIREFENLNDDYNSIMIKALADRLAEAFAEYLHKEIRINKWGYSSKENLDNDSLIKEKYTGIRPAPGYPACPDHLEKKTLWSLLSVEESIGVKLTENLAMWPAASVSGYYFSNPNSKYFGLGKIKEDQLIDYSKRKNISFDLAEKWLKPNLL